MSSETHFQIRASSLPEYIDSGLHIAYAAFSQDPLSLALFALPLGADQQMHSPYHEWRIDRTRRRYHGKVLQRPHIIRMVLAEPEKQQENETTVGYAIWLAPKSKEEAEEEEQAKPKIEEAAEETIKKNTDYEENLEEVKDKKEAETDSLPEGMNLRLLEEVNNAVKKRSAKLLGDDFEQRYWYLQSLFTAPDYQRLGIGSRLLRYGLDQAKADTAARPEVVKGAHLVSTPTGLRTYLKGDMTIIGDMSVEVGEGIGEHGYKYVFLVKKFGEDASET